MRVLFINDSTTNPNWGGRAATISLREMIQRSGGTIVHTITINDIIRHTVDGSWQPEDATQPSSREQLKRIIPPWLLQMRLRLMPNLLRESGERLIPRSWEEYDRCVQTVMGDDTPWPRLMAAMQHADLVVVFGDGDIYGNSVVGRTLFFLSYLSKKHFDKRVAMVNHTADLEDPALRGVAREVYPLFDDVVFRDQVSLDLCREFCGGRFGADTAFWFQPAPRATWAPIVGRPTYFDVWPETASFDPSRPYLCVGGSSAFGPVENRQTIVSQYLLLIEHLRSHYSGQIVLTASDFVDQTVFRPVARQAGLPLVAVTTPVQQAVDIVGNADAYIGGRWHPGIFALRGGTPVLPLSAKTFKMQALTEMAGLSSTMFDAFDLDHEKAAIGRQLSDYLEQGDGLRDRLRSWADDMAKSSWENVAYLSRLSTPQE